MLDKLTIAGMLLQQSVLREDTSKHAQMFEQFAKHCAKWGMASTYGFVEGWWYSAGNRDPENHSIYVMAKAILDGK